MNPLCDYCRGPLPAAPRAGRPWIDAPPAQYCCYGCLSLGESDRAARLSPSAGGWKVDGFTIRIAISLVVVAQSMAFGLGLNMVDDASRSAKLFVQGTILAATLLVMALLGWPLLRNAWKEFVAGRISVEFLFLLTLAGAMAASLQSFITGEGPIYFEVVSVLLVVYSLGKAIGARSRAAALAGSRAWAGELSQAVLVRINGETRRVPVGDVREGDIVEVAPGASCPVDGVIVDGFGFVGEAATRGEPFPVVRRPGDTLLAGSVSHDSLLRVRAMSPGTERQVDRLLQAVEDARSTPVSVQSLADRLTSVFLPLLLLVAGGTFAFWAWHSGWQVGLFRAMSVLLVACPCALGLATPIVVWSALGRLAERGIVVQSGDVIERLAGVDCVFLDKTGTLTEDRFSLDDLATFAEGMERRRQLGWLAAVQARSSHPVAKPFAALFNDTQAEVKTFRIVPGCGVEAEIDDPLAGAHTVRVGRVEWLSKEPETLKNLETKLLATEGHRIAFALDGRLAGVAVLSEKLRDAVPGMLSDFGVLNLPVEVLTGDRTDRAALLGLPASRGDLLPDDKRRIIEEYVNAGGRPLMVGDGVNDAAALRQASVGVAMANGADISLAAADMVLYHPDVRLLPWAVSLSRRAMLLIRRNLWRAAAYNLFGMGLAACGLLHPVAAALLMVVSSLLVAWSSVRVGAPADPAHCNVPEPVRPVEFRMDWLPWKVFAHSLALLGQGILFVQMLNLTGVTAGLVVLAFLPFSLCLPLLWLRRPTLGHNADMSFGMLTLGNFGMVLGWWADNGFAPFKAGGCECVAAMHEGVFKPWMWVLMLVFSNLAMLCFTRRPHPNYAFHTLSMYTGGNIGMVLGMFSGGWAASLIVTEFIWLGVALSFLGMTVGMLAGMVAGTSLARWSLLFIDQLRHLPAWLRNAEVEEADIRS